MSGLKTVDILNEQNEFFHFNEVSYSARRKCLHSFGGSKLTRSEEASSSARRKYVHPFGGSKFIRSNEECSSKIMAIVDNNYVCLYAFFYGKYRFIRRADASP